MKAGPLALRAETASSDGPSRNDDATKNAEVANAIRREIDSRLNRLPASAPGPEILVAHDARGVLISLTDSIRFSMFATGSSEPRALLVAALAIIADVLSKRSGLIVIRGHTDSAPYAKLSNDNWKLSSDRAQKTLRALLRLGFPESRVMRIEGRADRELRNLANARAPENRRIEIFLELSP